MLHLDAGWGPGWQKYGGRGTLVIPMKSFSKAAEESEGCTEKDEILWVCVCVCAFWRRGVAAVFMCKTCSETSGRDRENTTEKLFADYIAEAYRHASPHTSPCLKIQILNQLPHMNKQHEIQQQTSSPVIQKQKENLLFSTVKVALD